MSDSNKSRDELLAEIAALRAKLGDEPSTLEVPEQASGSRITRRDVLASAWVAPIILTVPLGASISPRAQAQLAPTAAPTTAPTVAPTTAPTVAPTTAPTTAPTVAPTTAPTAAPPVTTAPTAFPTSAPGVIPVEISGFEIS